MPVHNCLWVDSYELALYFRFLTSPLLTLHVVVFVQCGDDLFAGEFILNESLLKLAEKGRGVYPFGTNEQVDEDDDRYWI